MMKATRRLMIVFASDLHLDYRHPERLDRFRRFVDRIIADAGSEPLDVYFAGDLFDWWYEYRDAIFTAYEKELDELKRLAARARTIVILKGNHDFFYRDGIAKRIAQNITVSGDRIVIDACGKKILIEHGDLLCGNDPAYLRFRRRIRSRLSRFAFWLMPFRMVIWLVRKLEAESEKHKANLDAKWLSISPELLTELFNSTNCDAIVCGHVHQASEINVSTSKGDRTGYVLGGWFQRIEYLTLTESGFEHHTIEDDAAV